MQDKVIGYIGLGTMGSAMAGHLLSSGFPLIVWNRTAIKAQALLEKGAIWAESPAVLAAQCDVVFINVSDTKDVLEVIFGENGVAQGISPGTILIDNSTIAPTGSREIADKLTKMGVRCLDAPVSGGDIGARNATLTIMVGGDEATLEEAKPYLEVLGKKITHVGGHGAGQIAKAANQIMVAAQMVAEAELMIFAQKAGADPAKVVEAINAGAAQCWTLDVKAPKLLNGEREPGFKATLQAKDMNIAVETARAYHMNLPATALHTQLYNGMVAIGDGDLDNSAIISMIEVMNGEKLKTKESN